MAVKEFKRVVHAESDHRLARECTAIFQRIGYEFDNIPLNTYVATTDPGSTDDSTDGWAPGSRWFNVAQAKLWECVDSTAEAASWLLVMATHAGATAGAPGIDTASDYVGFFDVSDDLNRRVTIDDLFTAGLTAAGAVTGSGSVKTIPYWDTSSTLANTTVKWETNILKIQSGGLEVGSTGAVWDVYIDFLNDSTAPSEARLLWQRSTSTFVLNRDFRLDDTIDLIFTEGADTSTFTCPALTADRTVTIPDGSGTLAFTSDIITDHGGLSGLTDDDHSQYALLAGRSGGQTLTGGTGSVDNLTLSSTSHANKGFIVTDSNVVIGIGTAGVNYYLFFDGEDNDGVLTWMEDEDYFQFSDDVLFDGTERAYFSDTNASIHASSSGILQVTATRIDFAADGNFGEKYCDFEDIAVPSNPAVGVRRLFVDTNNGELSVRTNSGTTVSLEGGGGATTFTGLTDTPSSYSSQAGKVLQVNSGETAVEFTAKTYSATFYWENPQAGDVFPFAFLESAGTITRCRVKTGSDSLTLSINSRTTPDSATGETANINGQSVTTTQADKTIGTAAVSALKYLVAEIDSITGTPTTISGEVSWTVP